jgi:hypothetical protein
MKVSRSKLLEDVDVEILARLLQFLERSVRMAETIDIFPGSTARRPADDNGYIEDEELDDETRLRAIEDRIDRVMNGIEAATAAFTIMSGGSLSKQVAAVIFNVLCLAHANACYVLQLYPEDVIVSSLNLVKNQLTGVIYRVFEMSSSSDGLPGAFPCAVRIGYSRHFV